MVSLKEAAKKFFLVARPLWKKNFFWSSKKLSNLPTIFSGIGLISINDFKKSKVY